MVGIEELLDLVNVCPPYLSDQPLLKTARFATRFKLSMSKAHTTYLMSKVRAIFLCPKPDPIYPMSKMRIAIRFMISKRCRRSNIPGRLSFWALCVVLRHSGHQKQIELYKPNQIPAGCGDL
jgi:hypothetical protein